MLKNTVIFPDVNLPILVNKKLGNTAIEEAIKGERLLFVVAVKNNQEAVEQNLFRIGSLCYIDRLEKRDNGEQLIHVHSIDRYRILEFRENANNGIMEATGEVLQDIYDLDIDTENALLKNLKELSFDILNIVNASSDLKKALEQFTKVGPYTNMAAQNMPIPVIKKQEILELVSIKSRALKVLELLVEQREIMRVNSEMGTLVSQKTSKSYRESILREQMRAIQEELGEAETNEAGVSKTLKERVIEAKMPKDVEKIALEQAKRLDAMGAQNAESHVIRSYVELLIELPWSDPVSTDIDLVLAQKILDDEHFGLDKIKKHIIQHLAVMKMAPNKKGSILLFVGPPGVGKTSLGQSIAKSLGRKFVRVSLGGVRDDSEIRGHRRTYIGALPGRIIEGIKRAREKNPVFMLDEIDKLSRSHNGDPGSAMLEVLDPEQNATFTDHYVDVPFDLSKVFFIATANTLDTIPLPLLDRMEVIHLSGYTIEEKLHIARKHLLNKQIIEHGLNLDQISVSDDILKILISDYTREAGVRELQRKISSIMRAAVEKIIAGESVVIIDKEIVEAALGHKKISFELAQKETIPGVVTGLAWTPVGGDILFIESAMMPGNGKIMLTGKLGDVMSESAHIALSLVRSRLSGVANNFDFSKNDFHIHVPSGSIHKDGPSAGVTMFTALCSLVLNKTIDPKLAMTGEITLRGVVMPVGGIKEKVIAAHRAGIKRIIMSQKNQEDLKEVPNSVANDIEFLFVENISELLNYVFGKMPNNNYNLYSLPNVGIEQQVSS